LKRLHSPVEDGHHTDAAQLIRDVAQCSEVDFDKHRMIIIRMRTATGRLFPFEVQCASRKIYPIPTLCLRAVAEQPRQICDLAVADH
jgi:hypothetical protein